MELMSMIESDVTVRELMQSHPVTTEVFRKFGMDTCCGAGVPILVAAQRDGADAGELLAALRALVEEA